MNSFQKMETKKIRPIKNTWYCLINYIPEPPIRKSEDLKIKLSVFLRQHTKTNCLWERKETKQTKKKY